HTGRSMDDGDRQRGRVSDCLGDVTVLPQGPQTCVSGLKVSPQTAIFFSVMIQTVSGIDFRKRSWCSALMRWTSFKREKGTPSFSLMVMNAAMSFGKHDPP